MQDPWATGNSDEKKTQIFWEENYPQAVDNVGVKLLFLRGMLSRALIHSDGDSNEKEIQFVNKLPKMIIGETKEKRDIFCAGIKCHHDKKISNLKVISLCSQLKNKSENRNTIKMLLKISVADGLLDKGEYTFIKQLAQLFELNIPDFDDLASTLNLDTSNLKKDKIIRTTGHVASKIGKGAIVVGGVLLTVLMKILDEADNSKKTDKSPAKKTVKKPPSQRRRT
ncbi:TerB family tellurite resistance protein [Psychromonas sp. KJ10-10]|uniref:TerB family tellurite resistance protein n=1 Tax=Psychromonas sp. KJ10-10 TaxID=3391823 RepID=UPI0039B3C6B8